MQEIEVQGSEMEDEGAGEQANKKMPRRKKISDLNRGERRKYLTRSEKLEADLKEGNAQIAKEAKKRKQKRKAQRSARKKNRR